MLSALPSLALLAAAAVSSTHATALVAGQVAVSLSYNPDYAPTAVDLLTDGILRYDLFKSSVTRFPLLGKALRTAKLDIALGKRASFTGRSNAARAVHNRRLLGLKLDLGLDLSIPGLVDTDVDAALDGSVDLGAGTIVDENWGTSTTRLTNSQKDNAWFGTIGFGTPAQNITMLLDTGSADTITLSRGCTTCQLNNHTAFDGSKSSTYMPLRKAFTVAYGDGTRMSGTLAKDKVQLAPAVVAEQQLLASVTQKEKGSGAGLWSGILGLGPDQLSYIEDNVTPPSNLIKAGKLAEPLFGVALIPAKQGPRIGGGEYKWGAITQNYIKGDLVYTNVTSSFYWGVDMQEIYYGSDKKLMAAADARRCIIDTGTTLIYTSDAAAQALHASIPGASRNQQDGAYYVPCNINNFVGNVLDVFIEIGGRKWGITSEDLAFRPSGRNDGLCVSGIQGGANQFTVLGDVFIKNHYLVFNYGSADKYSLKVGIADRIDIRSFKSS